MQLLVFRFVCNTFILERSFGIEAIYCGDSWLAAQINDFACRLNDIKN